MGSVPVLVPVSGRDMRKVLQLFTVAISWNLAGTFAESTAKPVETQNSIGEHERHIAKPTQ